MTRLIPLAVVAALVAPAPAAAATRISVGTGTTGGVYYFVGTAMTKILNQYLPGVNATPEPVTGSAHATKLTHSGELTIALAELATVYHGYRGSRRDFDKKYENVRFMMAGMDNGQAAVVWADSPVKSYADLKGKRVAANSPASRAMLVATMEAYGLKEADAQHKTLNYPEMVSAMKDGSIDVGFFSVGPRNATVIELAAARPIRILGVEGSKAKEFNKAHPHWTAVPLKGGTYPGQEADLPLPSFYTTLIANKDADATLVYSIVQTIIGREKEFGELHPSGKEFTVEKTRFYVENGLVPVPWHPGAERYWRERGVIK
jgi:hypothetical protein